MDSLCKFIQIWEIFKRKLIFYFTAIYIIFRMPVLIVVYSEYDIYS